MGKNKDLESRLTLAEKKLSWLTIGGGVLALFGLSAGGLLWQGYSTLRDKELAVRNDFMQIEKEYAEAQKDIVNLKAENAKVLSSTIDKYDKMSESYLVLRTKVTAATEAAELAMAKAGNLVVAVEQAKASALKSEALAGENAKILAEVQSKASQVEMSCKAIKDAQYSLEAYLSDAIKKVPAKPFVVQVTGFCSTCTFVEGKSIPYPRTISGNNVNAVVVVPPDAACIVKVTGNNCHLQVQEKLRGQVIVEAGGFCCDVRYIK